MEHSTESALVPALVDNEHFLKCQQIIVGCYDAEIIRLGEDASVQKVLTVFNSLFRSCNYYSFFTPQSLKELTEQFFDNSLMTRFILNLTERASIQLQSVNMEYEEFVDSILKGIVQPKKSQHNVSLIPEQIQASIHVNPETLKKVLIDNMWLVVLYILVHNYIDSKVFQQFATDSVQAPARK